MTTESILDVVESAATSQATVHLTDAPHGVTVGQLWSSAHLVARRLDERWRSADVVAGWLDPSTGSLSALLGCWIAGRAFVSLPQRGRGVGAEAHGHLIDGIVSASGASLVLGPGGVASGTACTARERSDPHRAPVGPGLVQFTSGTTGDPRSVALGIEQLGTNARAIQLALGTTSADVFFSWLPLSHDMGLVGMFLAPLAAFGVGDGSRPGALWIRPPETFLLDPASWLSTGAAVGGTVTMAPNFALDLAAARHRDADLSSLRCIVVGAETVRRATLRRAEDQLGRVGLRGGVLAPGYGLAEATLGVSTVRPGSSWRTRPDPSGRAAEADVVSLGRPLPGVRVRITGDREWGPIEVASPSLGQLSGSHRDRLSPDGWLTTGDEGFIEDGELHFIGREEGRIVVAGRTLDTEGLRVLLSAVTGVRTGCCAIVPGRDEGFVVVVEPSRELAAREMPGLCLRIDQRSLDLIGARPVEVVVVERGALLKTPSGKVRQEAISATLCDGTLPVEHRSGLRSGRRVASDG